MVHQHFMLISNYAIAENIVLGIEPQKKLLGVLPTGDLAGAHDRIRKPSPQYGLEVDPTAKTEDINVSTQQRAKILKMLYRNAEILIFDEPTAMLTPQEIDSLLEIIKTYATAAKESS